MLRQYANPQADDDDDVLSRPPWIKFYYMKWMVSTMSMTAEQRGWYMQLLMTAASQGDPPGYLEDDEKKLRKLAGVQDLPTPVQALLVEGVQVSPELLKKFHQQQNELWYEVKNKFKSSKRHPGMVRNKRLLTVLQEAYSMLKGNILGGIRSAEKRALNKRKGRASQHQLEDTSKSLPSHLEDTHNYARSSSFSTSKESIVEKEEATSILSLELEETEIQERKINSTLAESKSKVSTDDILHIYKFWKTELGLGSRQLTDERKKKIRVRLETDSTIEEIEMAIRGCKSSEWHMGMDENSPRPYNDIAQDICRNRGTVEKFISIYENNQRRKETNADVNSGQIQTRRTESKSERESRIHNENSRLFAAEDTKQLQATSEVDD